jgi:hypothetical protein
MWLECGTIRPIPGPGSGLAARLRDVVAKHGKQARNFWSPAERFLALELSGRDFRLEFPLRPHHISPVGAP